MFALSMPNGIHIRGEPREWPPSIGSRVRSYQRLIPILSAAIIGSIPRHATTVTVAPNGLLLTAHAWRVS